MASAMEFRLGTFDLIGAACVIEKALEIRNVLGM